MRTIFLAWKKSFLKCHGPVATHLVQVPPASCKIGTSMDGKAPDTYLLKRLQNWIGQTCRKLLVRVAREIGIGKDFNRNRCFPPLG